MLLFSVIISLIYVTIIDEMSDQALMRKKHTFMIY